MVIPSYEVSAASGALVHFPNVARQNHLETSGCRQAILGNSVEIYQEKRLATFSVGLAISHARNASNFSMLASASCRLVSSMPAATFVLRAEYI